MKNKLLTLTIFAGVTTASTLISTPALGCACCAESNTWQRYRSAPSEYELSVMADLSSLSGQIGPRFLDRQTVLQMNEESVPISGQFISPNTWEFSFLLAYGTESQPVSFTFQTDSMWEFSDFDINVVGDSPTYPGHTTTLYKEVMIPGTVTFSEPLATALNNSQATGKLIFQGYGGRCLSSESFSNWILQMSVPHNLDSGEIRGFGRL